MSPAPALKIIEGGRADDGQAPAVPPVLEGERLYPVFDIGGRGAFVNVVAASLILHGALIAVAIGWDLFGEERAIGGSDETIVIERVEITLLDQIPNIASPLIEAEAVDEVDISEPIEAIETASATVGPEAGSSPAPGEAIPVPSESAMQVPAEAAPVAEQAVDAEPSSSIPSENARTDAAVELVDEPASEIREDRRPAPMASRAIPLIETAPVTDTPDLATASIDAAATPVVDAEEARAVETIPEEVPPSSEEAVSVVEDLKPLKPVEEAEIVAAVDLAEEVPLPPRKPADLPAATPAPAKSKSASQPKPSSASSKSDVAARGPTKNNAGAGGKTSGSRGTASLSTYQSRLVAHLRRYRTYPSTARSKRLTGTAVVSFTIDKNGRVVGSSLAKGTGHQILDREAIAMVRRASPFPSMPAGLGKSRLTVRAPIRFDMR